MDRQLRKKMNRVIDAFDNASDALARKGSRLPAEWYDIEETHRASRQALVKFIEEMCGDEPTGGDEE